jgi:glucuronosyltransferase
MNTTMFFRHLFSLLIRSSEEGYALKLEWEDLNEELLYESIQNLLHDPRYKDID